MATTNLSKKMVVYIKENSHLRRELDEQRSQEGIQSAAELSLEEHVPDPEGRIQAQKDLAKAKLRIEELEADLEYFRHLDRGSDKP